MTPSETVERFLATGEVDLDFPGWEGGLTQRRRQGTATLSRILDRVVEWRSDRAPLPVVARPVDASDRVQTRIGPMVSGLLRAHPATADLSPQLVRSVCRQVADRVQVLSVDTFPAATAGEDLELQWTLANLLLDGLGAPPLSDEAPQLDGFCQDGRAWVLARALVTTSEWSDVVVHESAHLLHELTRGQLGLGPSDAALLPCAPADQETFAFTCELWSCLHRRALGAGGPSSDDHAAPHHAAALEALLAADPSLDPRVDRAQLVATLTAAVAQPDAGWAIIARALAPPPRAAQRIPA